MAFTGFTGTPVHTGSWGLPDFGISEILQGKLSTSPSPTGLITNVGTPANTPQTTTAPALNYSTALNSGGLTGTVAGTNTTAPLPQVRTPQSILGEAGLNPADKDAAAKALGYTGYSDYQDQQRLAQQYNDYQAQLPGMVDSEYSGVFDLLNNQEQGVRAGEQDLYKQATSPYDAQMPLLNQAKSEGLTAANQTGQDAQLQSQNALAAARSLYNELTRGSQQKYGGTSSAGDFANAFLGRELQKNIGGIQQTTGQNMQKVVQRVQQISDNYNTQLQALEQQKQGDLAKARDVFQQRLDAINNARLGATENKAQLKLQALQQLRQEALTVQQNYTQFQQQLQLNAQTAQLNLQNSIAQYRAQNGQPMGLNSVSGGSFSGYGGGTQPTTYDASGQIYGQQTAPKKSKYPWEAQT